MRRASWLAAITLVATATGCRTYFEDRELRARAAKCGSEVAWAADWRAAAARAGSEGKLVLVAFQNYPGFEVGDLPSLGPFMDEEIVALANASFVPLRLRLGMEAPFVSSEVYGIGESAFGVALLLADPNGRIVAETFSLDSAVVLEFLKRAAGADAAERALAARAEDASPLVHEAIRRARSGDVAGARSVLEPGADDSPRARFLAALLRLAAGEKDEAIAALRVIGLEEPESRWSWHAAAIVTNPILTAGESFSFVAPDRDLIEEGMPLAAAPVQTSAFETARRQAVDWLATRQRADGSWTDPHRISKAGSLEFSDLSLATTALCGLALLSAARDRQAAGDPEGASAHRAHAARALAWLAAHTPESRAGASFMDYSVWSNPYTLRFAVECRGESVGDSDLATALAERCLAAIVARQKDGGGWSYYLSGSLEDSDRPLNVSMSFTTACVLDALQRARAGGMAIPDGVESRAIDCLLDMRSGDGRFGYLRLHTLGLTSRGSRGDAAGRGPACTLPLVVAGELDDADLLRALEEFVAHLPVLKNEQGKVLMHCGPEAEGSHYLLFDYLNAATALARLGPEERGRFREPVLAAILESRCDDGSFVDNPGIGRAAGTALATLAFDCLEVVPGTGLEPAPP